MEQQLIDDLIVESIKIYGHDLFYLPRTLVKVDNVLTEDTISEFNGFYMLEMYIKNVEGFGGQGDFLSKFNLQINDTVTFTVSRRVFSEEVGSYTSQVRPKEGDLIYFPLNRKLFEIKFVEHEAIFYQMGSLQTFDIQCELFVYNNEKLNTGIKDIDDIEKNYSTSMSGYGILTESGLFIQDENGFDLVQEKYDINTADPIADNDDLQTESDNILDFTELDPFSETGRI
jgi:hypothetical protein